jgi:hypothetical protein
MGGEAGKGGHHISLHSSHAAIVIGVAASGNPEIIVVSRLVDVRLRPIHHCRLPSLRARTIYSAAGSLRGLENTHSTLQRTWQQCERQHIERLVVPRSVGAHPACAAIQLRALGLAETRDNCCAIERMRQFPSASTRPNGRAFKTDKLW